MGLVSKIKFPVIADVYRNITWGTVSPLTLRAYLQVDNIYTNRNINRLNGGTADLESEAYDISSAGPSSENVSL